MSEIIILPGHYQTKTSIGSDQADIIRIIGPDPKNDNNWLTIDNHSIPTYVLQENYVPLDTVPTLKHSQKIRNKSKLFADFEPVNMEDVSESKQTIPSVQQQVIDHNELKSSIKVNDGLNPENTTPLQKINFDTEILEKIKISNNKRESINISFNIELDYDLDKLDSLIEILSLNPDEMFKAIAYQIKSDIVYDKISEALKNRKQDVSVIADDDEIEDIVFPKELYEQKIDEPDVLTEGIKELDSLIGELSNTQSQIRNTIL